MPEGGSGLAEHMVDQGYLAGRGALGGAVAFSSPFRGVWQGLACFILGVVGFIAMMLPLGTSPTLLSFCLLCGGLALVRRRRLPWDGWAPALGWRHRPVWPALAIFFAWAFLSTLWAIVRPAALVQMGTFVYTFVPFALVWPLLGEVDERRRRQMMDWAVGGMLLALALFVIEVFLKQPLYRAEKAFEGTALDLDRALNRPAADFVLLAWPAGLALALRGWRRVRAAAPLAGLSAVPWAWVLPLAFFLVCLRGPSASARVGFILGLAVYALARWRPGVARRVLVVLTLAGPLLSIPIALFLRRLDLVRAEWLPFSFRHRVEIWDVAARRILERPVLGWGLDSSPYIPDEGQVSLFHPESHLIPLHPHNIFLQTLMELGVVGAVLYAALGLALLWGTRALPRWAQPTALAMYMGGLAVGCFAYGAWQTWWLSGVLLSLIFLRLSVPTAPLTAPSLEKSRLLER